MPQLQYPIAPDGLIVDVRLTADSKGVTSMLDAGERPPMAFARALIDTGSDVTVVSPTLLHQVRATLYGTNKTTGIGGVTPVRLHLASLYIFNASSVHDPWIVRSDLIVMELPMAIEYDVLIGMDVIRTCRLDVDGPGRRFSLVG